MTESCEQTGTTATMAGRTATSGPTSRAVDTAKPPDAPVAAPGVAKPDDTPSSVLSYIEPLGVPIDGSVAPTAERAVSYQRSDAPPLSSHRQNAVGDGTNHPENSKGSADEGQEGDEEEDSRRNEDDDNEEGDDSEAEGSVLSRKKVPRAMTEDVTGVGGAFDGLHPPAAHSPEDVEYPSP